MRFAERSVQGGLLWYFEHWGIAVGTRRGDLSGGEFNFQVYRPPIAQWKQWTVMFMRNERSKVDKGGPKFHPAGTQRGVVERGECAPEYCSEGHVDLVGPVLSRGTATTDQRKLQCRKPHSRDYSKNCTEIRNRRMNSAGHRSLLGVFVETVDETHFYQLP